MPARHSQRYSDRQVVRAGRMDHLSVHDPDPLADQHVVKLHHGALRWPGTPSDRGPVGTREIDHRTGHVEVARDHRRRMTRVDGPEQTAQLARAVPKAMGEVDVDHPDHRPGAHSDLGDLGCPGPHVAGRPAEPDILMPDHRESAQNGEPQGTVLTRRDISDHTKVVQARPAEHLKLDQFAVATFSGGLPGDTVSSIRSPVLLHHDDIGEQSPDRRRHGIRPACVVPAAMHIEASQSKFNSRFSSQLPSSLSKLSRNCIVSPATPVEDLMAEQLKTSLLAPATGDTDEASEHLLRYGVCRLEGALPSKDLNTLRSAVKAAATADAAENQAYRYSHGANHRIWSLFNRGDCFLELAENPAVLRVVRTVLGDDA